MKRVYFWNSLSEQEVGGLDVTCSIDRGSGMRTGLSFSHWADLELQLVAFHQQRLVGE